jgi:hypothetical protein
MANRVTSILDRLERLKDVYGDGVDRRKLELLDALDRSPLSRAKQVSRLHEVLCFLRAYPDSRAVLNKVERILKGFSGRRDLMAHSKALTNSGIAGTPIKFPFYWFTAYWLAKLWPESISIDWAGFEKKSELAAILPLLLPYSETPALDELDFSAREWVRRLKGPDETDAYFLIRRFKALRADDFGKELSYERLNIPIRLEPGPDTPSRTHAIYPARRIAFQMQPLSKGRASFRRDVRRSKVSVRPLGPRDARRIIHLAREAMVTRSRDLDAFEHASEADVRLVDCGRGLQFACIGVVPERRLLLEAVYAFLTLKNGVPIGYVLVGSLFRSSEVAFNMFETYRGAESSFIYSRVLAMVRHLFGSDVFMVPPYQLGYENPEALRSGAWWFYYKLGFGPHDRDVRRLLRAELAKMKKAPRYRSDVRTLNKLASENLFLYLGKRRAGVMGRISIGDIGLRITDTLAGRFGADRETGVKNLSREAAGLLGVRSFRGFSAGERLAWERWSPLIMTLPDVDKWHPEAKRALVRVVRAKGRRRESEFVRLSNGHGRLQRAVLTLAREE